MKRIFADFNNFDTQGRVRLNTNGTKEDLKKLELRLVNGMKLLLYDDGLQVEAVVEFSNEENIWVATIDVITNHDEN